MNKIANIVQVPIDYDLDVVSVPHTRATLDSLIDGGCRRIILNFAGAQYMDSSGMALICSEISHMQRLGGLLSFVNVPARILRTLKICRVVDLVPVTSTNFEHHIQELDPSVAALWQKIIQVDAHDLASTRKRVEELLKRTPLDANQIFDVMLACGEAMGNAIDHTDGGCALVSIACFCDRARIEVTDCGCASKAQDQIARAMQEAVPSLERGRGIKLMRLLADNVQIFTKPSGKGTCVRIEKLYQSPAQVL